jgi:hypothetical protein
LSISVRLRNLIRGGLGPVWAGAPYKKKKKKEKKKVRKKRRKI